MSEELLEVIKFLHDSVVSPLFAAPSEFVLHQILRDVTSHRHFGDFVGHAGPTWVGFVQCTHYLLRKLLTLLQATHRRGNIAMLQITSAEVTRQDGMVDSLSKLSLASQKDVRSLTEVLIAFGVNASYLKTDIGFVKFYTSELTETVGKLVSEVPTNSGLSPSFAFSLFFKSLYILLQLCEEEDLMLVIIPTYLVPILAGLLTICNSPEIQAREDVVSVMNSVGNSGGNSIMLISISDKQWANTKFEEILRTVCKFNTQFTWNSRSTHRNSCLRLCLF